MADWLHLVLTTHRRCGRPILRLLYENHSKGLQPCPLRCFTLSYRLGPARLVDTPLLGLHDEAGLERRASSRLTLRRPLAGNEYIQTAMCFTITRR